MKRSEMLNLIDNHLKNSDFSDIIENSDYHARIFLNIIEQAGMRPPYLGDFWTSDGGELDPRRFQWEPEDG